MSQFLDRLVDRSAATRIACALVFAAALASACGGAQPSAAQRAARESDSAAAVAALAATKFAEAHALASAALGKDGGNARAAAVRAIASYHAAGSRLRDDLDELMDADDALFKLEREEGRAIWQRFAEALAKISGDLAIAAKDPAFSLELCLACWEHDWNHSGEVDVNDRLLFEIEYERSAGPEPKLLPPGDPRRRPTFRFDAGDVEWALAMVDFQRAAIELLLSYRWSTLWTGVVGVFTTGQLPKQDLVVKLGDPARVRRAHELILSALDHADRCRVAYLAETDDDREWVPNPKQQSFAVPLPVDATLYQTWADVVSDVRRMLRSEAGLSVRTLAAMGDRNASAFFPDGFIDLGSMLREPQDLVIRVAAVEALGSEQTTGPAQTAKLVEDILRGLLGKGYANQMPPSELPRRLDRMKQELLTGHDTFDRKLRYLLWLN